MVLIILAMAAVTVAMVHVRREQIRARHQLQQLRLEQVQLRRKVCDQQAQVGILTAPKAVRQRVGELAVGLVERYPPTGALTADRPSGRR